MDTFLLCLHLCGYLLLLAGGLTASVIAVDGLTHTGQSLVSHIDAASAPGYDLSEVHA